MGAGRPGLLSTATGLVLVAAVVLVYLNSLTGPFILDDAYSVHENRAIRSLWPPWNAMFKAIPDSPPAGRPIVGLSLAINYALGGFDVRGYHVFNIAVHAACVLVLWGVLRRSIPLFKAGESRAAFPAFVIALLWAVHPLATESVTYISQRTELLMGLFYLLTLYCAIRSWEAPDRPFWIVLAIGCCALGMGCKESMVSAPLFVLLFDVVLVSKSWRRPFTQHAKLYLGLAATWAWLLVLNISGPRSQTCGTQWGLSSLDYLFTQAGIIVRYLRLCFWPHPLVITYDDWPIAQGFAEVLPQGLLILAMLALTVWLIVHHKPAGLLGAWFFLILAPTSSFVPIVTEIAAERRMYLPLAAVVMAVILGTHATIVWVRQRYTAAGKAAASAALMVLVVVVSALGSATVARNRDYRTAVSIWTDTLAKRPLSWMALNNLCMALLDTGENDRVISYSNQAIERKPTYADGHYNRGLAYEQKGDREQALRDYSRAIELDSHHVKAYNNRAVLYGEAGDFARAIQDCTRAIELKGDYAEAYYNRGLARGEAGEFELAVRDFTAAIALEPGDAEFYNHRARMHYLLKAYDRAAADLNTCRRLGGTPDTQLTEMLRKIGR